MNLHSFDEAPWTNAATPATPLARAVFELYREAAKERDAKRKALAELEQQFEKERGDFRKRLARLGAEVFQFERCLASVRLPMSAANLGREQDRLDMMLRRFHHALKAQGVDMPDLEGAELDDSLADLAEVLSAIPGPVHAPRVKEVVEPLVCVDGQPVLRPKLISEVPEQPA